MAMFESDLNPRFSVSNGFSSQDLPWRKCTRYGAPMVRSDRWHIRSWLDLSLESGVSAQVCHSAVH